MGRSLVRGVLDSFTAVVAAVLIAANTGFLPVTETQQAASAVFGRCSGVVPCPDYCYVTFLVESPEPPGYQWITEMCIVPNGQWVGNCTGLCGICPVWYRCFGTTYELFLPCNCTSGCS